MLFKNPLPWVVAAMGIIGIFSIGCKKSSNSISSNSAFSAIVDDTTFTPATNGTGAVYTSLGKQFDIYSYLLRSKDTVSLDVSIFEPFTVNQPIDPTANASSILYYDFTGEPFFNGVGMGKTTITVTSLDTVNHKIAGTFSGNLYENNGSGDSVIVANGTFNTTYLVQ
jgi:hypothetical protein